MLGDLTRHLLMQGVETLLTETRQLLNIDDSVHQVLPDCAYHASLPFPQTALSVWPACTTMLPGVAVPGTEKVPHRVNVHRSCAGASHHTNTVQSPTPTFPQCLCVPCMP